MTSHNYAGLPQAAPLGASYLQLFVPPDPETGSVSGSEAQNFLAQHYGLVSEVRPASTEEFCFLQASDGSQVIIDRDAWDNFEHRTAVARHFFINEGCYVHFIFLKLGKFGAVLVPNWHLAGVNGKKLYHP